MIEEHVRVLRLSLHGITAAHLAGYEGGRNVLTFDPGFVERASRPTFTLTTHPGFPQSEERLRKPWSTRQRLHPVLSNLLPEGALREWLAQALKIHIDSEFALFAHLGLDLPGALIAEPLQPNDVPDYALEHRAHVEPVPVAALDTFQRFSLAGVQIKFSMRAQDGRYHVAPAGELGGWIVKMPSTRHEFVPQNEYSAMTLAGLAGIDIPDIRLVPLSALGNLPPLNLPDEQEAFAIRRFDRDGEARIHTEDFAQVFMQYAHEKYARFNYAQIGRVLYQYTGRNLANAQQFARRLLVNILLANGDAHLKNWTLIYPDNRTAELAPAYDIVTTRAYIEDERKFALNLAGTKSWYDVTLDHFADWARRAEIPWRAVRPHLEDTLEKARALWTQELERLPMLARHKEILREHWKQLQPDLRIE